MEGKWGVENACGFRKFLRRVKVSESSFGCVLMLFRFCALNFATNLKYLEERKPNHDEARNCRYLSYILLRALAIWAWQHWGASLCTLQSNSGLVYSALSLTTIACNILTTKWCCFNVFSFHTSLFMLRLNLKVIQYQFPSLHWHRDAIQVFFISVLIHTFMSRTAFGINS